MKKLVVVFFISFYLVSLQAQSASDSSMYNKGLYLLDKAVTTENFLEVAFYFEELSREYSNQWLIPYYAGLSCILASQKALDSKYKDALLDKAQPYVTKAFTLKPGEAEIHILQAFLFQTRLMVDPQSRAMNFAPKADAAIKKAMAADPSNPRAYFLQGNNVYYTPVVFKGGPKNALPLFLKAKEKYALQDSTFSFMPGWGKHENQEMINACNISLKKQVN